MVDLIHELARLIVQDNAILFVGTGLRRDLGEIPAVQQIADALAERINYQRPDRSLSAVARDFEVLRGRHDLILALREELARFESRPAPVHQLIADAVLPQTKVITTRFDRLLEQALERCRKPYVLIVRDTDLPFFDETKVTLIKMQGDISQPDSLVITQDDIEDFISKLPTISDVVRAFFATKTLIFLGYDLTGEQFKKFYRQVTRNLAGYHRTAYAVTSQPVDEVERRYWQNQNVQVCPRDPLTFLEALTEAVKAATRQLESTPRPVMPLPPLPARPYKALDSFTGADAAIFSGRAEESQRLANRILAHRLTVLYGESGSGKTSLLQAGVAPLLAQHRALLAVCALTAGQLLAELAKSRTSLAAGLACPAEATLAGLIRERQRSLGGPVVLALDQFEQFFLAYDPQERAAGLGLLGELIADHSLDLRLVFSLREDYLGQLQPLEAQIPGLLDVRFRLERLGREAARSAIEEPARLFNASWEPALVEVLLDDLYESTAGGVAPPQLQIVCDRLYQAASERAGAPAGEVRITATLFRKLGGTTAILGDYLDRSVLSFPPERQPTVRALLGALVGSGGVKQRLPLDDLARAAEVEPAEALAILDELTRQRLVQRYEMAAGPSGTWLEYELTHDYLVARIARWLGDDFWQAQKVREIVRQTLPDWQSRGRLPAPGDLQLAAARQGRVRFSPAEAEMLYAAAVGYDQNPASWQALLSTETCRRILLRLMDHPDPLTRSRAARALAAFPDEEVGGALAHAALADPQPAAREAAAHAVADLVGQSEKTGGQVAMAKLVAATADRTAADAAMQALVTVRDRQPAAHTLLPARLRGPVQRRVWAARRKRNREQILADSVQGLQAGFVGLGLGLGVIWGLIAGGSFSNLGLGYRIGLLLLGVVAAGGAGGVAVGIGAIASTILRHLQDRKRPWRTWAVTVSVTAGLFCPIWFALGIGTQMSARAASPWQTLLTVLLLGLGTAGVAALPLRWRWPWRLLLATLAGVAAFVLAGALGPNFRQTFLEHPAWLVLIGAAAGAGFFVALNPGFLRRTETRGM